MTGGSSKLGSLMAEAFAEEGANVAIHYHDAKARSQELAEVLAKKYGVKTKIFCGDIKRTGDIKRLVRSVASSFGKIDVLINNSAVFYRTPIKATTEKNWDDLLDTNLKGQFFMIKESLPFMTKKGLGRIINMADTYGASPSAGFVPYGISKAGVIAMTKGLAKELSPEILVNCVCPGIVESAHGSRLTTHGVKASDVVNAVLFLAKNDSMTGQSLFVDGGKNVHHY